MKKPIEAKRKAGRPRKETTEDDLIQISSLENDKQIPLRVRKELKDSSSIRWGYARVSTSAKKKNSQGESEYRQSIQSQLTYLLSRYKIEPRHIFFDRKSGVKERLSLEKLDQIARSGDEIVVFRLDRLGRSMDEVIHRVTSLNKRGIAVITASDGLVFSKENKLSNVILAIYSSLAELEREAIRERIAAGIQRGLEDHPERFGRPRIKTDKRKQIVKMRLQGDSPKLISRVLDVSERTVYSVFKQFKDEVKVNETDDKENFVLKNG